MDILYIVPEQQIGHFLEYPVAAGGIDWIDLYQEPKGLKTGEHVFFAIDKEITARVAVLKIEHVPAQGAELPEKWRVLFAENDFEYLDCPGTRPKMQSRFIAFSDIAKTRAGLIAFVSKGQK